MQKDRANILYKLMHEPGTSFNELWDHKGASNTFAYHINVLEEDGYIRKEEGKYFLTHTGKKYATYINSETGKKTIAPLVAVIVIVFNKQEDRVLMLKRAKEPFYGYWGFVGGKLEFNQYILECAANELQQETGLSCDLALKGLFSSKTYNDGELSYNHQLFIVKGTNPQGELLEQTREGKTQWFALSEVDALKKFPNVPKSIEIALSDNFRWVEADRMQEKDVFVDMKVRKNILI